MALSTIQQAVHDLANILGVKPLTIGLTAGFVGYLILCSSLRFQRLKSVRRRYNYPDRESLSRMTNSDARDILETVSLLEFPLLFDLSLRFALFKTYANDNVGNLLYSASDLAKPTQSSKRYDDTAVMYGCMFKFSPGSKELSQTIGRVNFLHNPYIKAGKIQNQDLLYVLFESMYEPVHFMRLYEWRELADVEVAAIAMVWKYIGEMMEIDYKAELGKDQWKDGVEFMEDVKAWAQKYQDEHLRPSPEIARVGQVSMELLLSSYPKFTRSQVSQTLLVLMGERMRWAFGFPEPGVAVTAFTFSALLIRKLFIRYLCLPRFSPLHLIGDPDPQTGRIQQFRYMKDPWYNPVTFWSRWGPEALVQRAFGLSIPGDGGPEMKPEGFLFTEIGPRAKVGKGAEETGRLAEVAHTKISPTSCPFSSVSQKIQV
ncbi:ER-bound oxygenase mpaB' [Cladobotryum mycophilum]|uniref:ER-bound oxygenase mpaB n=1 Tax=Cladobotryum mycophilum TaxID=491253 RepID=A0ABR0SCN7_9HYPO